MNKVIIDCATGEETIVPLTEAEIAENLKLQKANEERILAEKEAADAKAAARASALAKLEALGLSADEVKSLLG